MYPQRSPILICIAALFLAVLANQKPAMSQSSEGFDRLSEFLLKAAELRKDYSAIGRIVDTGPVDKDQKLEEITPPTEIMVRTVMTKNGKFVRIDKAYRTEGESNLAPTFELFTPEFQFLCFVREIPGPVEAIPTKVFYSISKVPKNKPTETWFVAPYLYPTLPLQAAVMYETEASQIFISGLMEGRFLDQGPGPNNTYVVVILDSKGRGATRLTFRNEPKWLIENVECFEIRGGPFDPAKFELPELKNLNLFQATRTEWAQQDDKWVPRRIVMMDRQKGPRIVQDVVIDILEWKFGKDVDSELLDPDKFTKESLKTVPFRDWLKQIEKQEKDLRKKSK